LSTIELRVVFANEALIRLGGYERGEMRGRTPDSIFPPEDLPHLMQQHAAALRHGHHRHEFYLHAKMASGSPLSTAAS